MYAFPRALAVATVLALLAGCSNAPPPPHDFSPEVIPDAFRYKTAALAHPLATRSMLVSPGGHLYNGEWWTRIEASSDGQEASAPRAIASEERWLPVVRWTRRAGPVRFDFEAVALPQSAAWSDAVVRPIARIARGPIESRTRREREAIVNSLTEDRLDPLLARTARGLESQPRERRNLLVSLSVRVSHLGRGIHSTRLALTFDPPGDDPPFLADDAVGPTPERAWRSASAAPGSEVAGDVLGWSELPARRTRAETAWVLNPGETRTARFVLSAYPVSVATLDRWAAIPHALRVDEARAYWMAEAGRGAVFELGDPEVESAIRAARIVLLECRERHEGYWRPIAGTFYDRDFDLREAARTIQALAVHGYVPEARELASALSGWQWPHGPFVVHGAELEATGQALWAYEQAFLRPSPDLSVGAYAQAAARAVAWCERQRARTTATVSTAATWAVDGSPAVGPDGTVAGLLPAADPKDHELVHGQLVGTDAWAIAGYRATVRLLDAAGRREAADQMRIRLAEYRSTFSRALAALGHADVPPSWSGTGLEWGNLAAAYPCGALPANDPHMAALAQRYWATAGGAGTGFYGTPSLLHGYVAADLGSWALMVGRRDEAEQVLDSLLHWRNASGAGAEMFTKDGDFGTLLPPRPGAASALLTLVRNSLVFDDGDTLSLTAGARRSWWNGSRARGLPTRWGNLDLEFRIREGRAEWRWTPVPVWTALTLPPGTIPRGALPRPLLVGSRSDVVLVPPGIGRADVTLGSLPVSVRWE